MGIFKRIAAMPPKTRVQPEYLVKGLGTSRNETALVYLVPSRKGGKPSEKRVRKSEWEAAHNELQKGGQFTRQWFDQNFRDGAAKDGSCSFRFIGEVFVLLEVAVRIDESNGLHYAFPK